MRCPLVLVDAQPDTRVLGDQQGVRQALADMGQQGFEGRVAPHLLGQRVQVAQLAESLVLFGQFLLAAAFGAGVPQHDHEAPCAALGEAGYSDPHAPRVAGGIRDIHLLPIHRLQPGGWLFRRRRSR